MDNEINDKVTPAPEIVQPNNEVKEPVVEETQEQINWKRFREERKAERKQAEESKRIAAEKAKEAEALKAALEAITSKPSPPQYNYEQPQPQEETEEQRIAKIVDQRWAEKERKSHEERLIREQQELPQKLSSAYSDFDKVCSEDNLDYLQYHYPEVASAYKQLPDNFDKWANIYKAVKKFVPNPDSQKDMKRADKNFNKPQSMASAGRTQTTDSAPQMLTEQRRADNWSRMQKRMKGIG